MREDEPVVGYLAFCGVKLVGYTIASYFIARSYRWPRNPLVLGGFRTLLGMVVGAAYWGLVFLAAPLFDGTVLVSWSPWIAYPIGLIPVRIAEWWLYIAIFFKRRPASATRRDWIIVILGVIASFLLDVPSVWGFFQFVRLHIC